MVDFFARLPHYIDHLAPIWRAMDPAERGFFYVPAALMDHARGRGVCDDMLLVGIGGSINKPYEVAGPQGNIPLVTCGYNDLYRAVQANPKRKNIFLQHGVGISFPNHDGYAGGAGVQSKVSLFLHPNEHVKGLIEKTFPNIPGVVVGTPKLDPTPSPSPLLRNGEGSDEKPVVCISFHWNGEMVAPEAGNAFEHFRNVLASLARSDEFTLIGHGHPRFIHALKKYYDGYGIETVYDFDEVMRRADVYVNDCSSTMYEFLTTGKPVVILNSPRFRRKMQFGIRFWDYTDIGLQVNQPEELKPAILKTLSQPEAWKEARENAVRDLYPYRGEAAKKAAREIEKFAMDKIAPRKLVDTVGGESIGILYMAFGAKAATEVKKSVGSLYRTGIEMPVCVVGDAAALSTFDQTRFHLVEWRGQSPFDASQIKNFQFRAGRVKPYLYELSPFERTLYIDADTEFRANILPAFEMLDQFDVLIARELLTIGQLYNKKNAGWEINIIERDETINELQAGRDVYFLNSGVIFFRKCEAVQKMMCAWGEEWLRYQQWDEQLSLMRALHGVPEIKLKVLTPEWNHPHRHLAGKIFHNYGRGVARMNVTVA